MEIQGLIKSIGNIENVTDSFRKRTLVITTNEQYPQVLAIEFTQDKCEVLNGYNIGESVKVAINLRGREWTNPQGETKYFTSLQGWKIERLNQSQNNQSQGYHGNGSSVDNYHQNKANNQSDKEDDLPF